MKTFFPVLFFLLISTFSQAQIKPGDRVLMSRGFIHSSTVDFHDRNNGNVRPSARSGYVNGSLHVIYGKVNNKMGLFGYGLGAEINTGKTKSNEGVTTSKYFGFGGGPVFTYQQFKKIADKLYYGPSAFISPRYSRGKTDFQDNETEIAKRWGATFYITPFAFAYMLKENIMLQVELGQFQVSYEHLTTENSLRPNYKSYQSLFETQTFINNHLSLGAAIVLK